MSRKSTSDLFAFSISYLNDQVGHFESPYTKRDKWDLESFLQMILNVFRAFKSDYQSWRVRVERQFEPFDVKKHNSYLEMFDQMADILNELETKIGNMEAVLDDNVAHKQDLYVERLYLQSLMKDKFVPAAPVSIAFQPDDLEEDEEDFLVALMSRKK